MNIISDSCFINFISKTDLSNFEKLENTVKESFIVKQISNIFYNIKSCFKSCSADSIFCKYIDGLILANLLILMVAITFTSTTILGILVSTSLILTLLRWFLVPDESHNFTMFDVPILLYVMIAVVSVAFSSYFMPSLKGFTKILIYLASYIAFTNIFKGKVWKIYFILAALAISGGLESLYGIYQKVVGVEALATWQDMESLRADQEMSRVYGTLLPYNPNLMAGYLLPIFPCALAMSIIFFIKRYWLAGITFLSFSCTTLLCIVFTGSRGAYIGVVFMAILIYFIAGHLIWNEFSSFKYSKYLKMGWIFSALAIVSFIVVAFLFVPALHDRVMSIFTLRGNSSNSYRMNVYIASIKMILDNWLIGIGPGNTTFRLVYGLYMVTGFDALGTYSVPLEIAVEMGIVGLIAFAWFALIMISNAIKTFLGTDNLEVKILIATVLTAFAGIAGQGVFDTIWYRPQVHIIFWAMVAILSCIVSKKVLFNGKNQ